MRASTIDIMALGRDFFDGALLLNGGFDAQSASLAVQNGDAEAVSFASLYIANPDLVERFRHHYPLAEPDPNLMYTPTREGYSDYSPYGGEG